MNIKVRKIEVDAQVADLLEARAAARGMTVSDLLADLACVDEALPRELATQRSHGEGPWSTQALAENSQRLAEYKRAREGVPWNEVKAWMDSWGKPDELPAPKSRKL